MNPTSLEPITTPQDLAAVIDDASTADAYALDTEFHREGTYRPRVALVQLAWHDQLVLIDPLKISIAPLADLLDGDGQAVLHAADQDLEVLLNECATLPRQMFDTQVGASFLGYRSPSLSVLHEHLLGVNLPKTARLSDWMKRPLSPELRDYAASDVARLIEIRDIICDDLQARGRLEWAVEECDLVLQKGHYGRPPEEAWKRNKEVRRLSGDALALAKEIATWREEKAARLNRPVRRVLSDLAVATIGQQAPKTTKQLWSIRGLKGENISKETARELLELVEKAKNRPQSARVSSTPRKSEVSAAMKPVVNLITSWVSQHAADVELDPAVLATRTDVEALVRGDPDCRALQGWRAEMVGIPAQRLLAGTAAVAFDGNGNLILEERSGRPVTFGKR